MIYAVSDVLLRAHHSCHLLSNLNWANTPYLGPMILLRPCSCRWGEVVDRTKVFPSYSW